MPPDLAFIQANANLVGHATMLGQTNGLNVLTDPVFSERDSLVQFAGSKRARHRAWRWRSCRRLMNC